MLGSTAKGTITANHHRIILVARDACINNGSGPKLYRKGTGKEAKLPFMEHGLKENAMVSWSMLVLLKKPVMRNASRHFKPSPVLGASSRSINETMRIRDLVEETHRTTEGGPRRNCIVAV